MEPRFAIASWTRSLQLQHSVRLRCQIETEETPPTGAPRYTPDTALSRAAAAWRTLAMPLAAASN